MRRKDSPRRNGQIIKSQSACQLLGLELPTTVKTLMAL
jgi:hypothetical protein